MPTNERKRLWERRKQRSRKQLRSCERPLLTVYRSSRHIYAQIVDPLSGRTLAGVSTRSPHLRGELTSTRDMAAASKIGAAIAQRALEKDIREVVFNRNGFVFSGRVKAIADAAREAGLSF
ncbi:MAG: 50S ribosomal protein L18 [Myxococcota bacterium]